MQILAAVMCDHAKVCVQADRLHYGWFPVEVPTLCQGMPDITVLLGFELTRCNVWLQDIWVVKPWSFWVRAKCQFGAVLALEQKKQLFTH